MRGRDLSPEREVNLEVRVMDETLGVAAATRSTSFGHRSSSRRVPTYGRWR
uniref:Uncharacterized protein n=1 Tax=Arundo donax TaxID=35708 RepID=A0A0A8Z5X9_ARUDO